MGSRSDRPECGSTFRVLFSDDSNPVLGELVVVAASGGRHRRGSDLVCGTDVDAKSLVT